MKRLTRTWKQKKPTKKRKPSTSYKGAVVSRPIAVISKRTGLGNAAWCKMIFSRKFSVGGGTVGSATIRQLRLNSINEVAVGLPSQPSTHDQMSALFEKYAVVSVKYKIVGANIATTGPSLVAVNISDTAPVTTDINLIIEQGQTDWNIVSPSNAGPNTIEFSGYVNMPNLMGVTRENYLNSSQFVTSFGSNPADVGFLTIYVADTSAGTASFVQFNVCMEMNVYLLGSNVVPAS